MRMRRPRLSEMTWGWIVGLRSCKPGVRLLHFPAGELPQRGAWPSAFEGLALWRENPTATSKQVKTVPEGDGNQKEKETGW